MALNSSGPISLAGSVTGESIAVELSQSPFASISLNDTNVRDLAGVASGAIIMPTDFWGKSSGSAWISYKDPSSTYTNVQISNFYYNSNNNKLYISAYESLGSGSYNTWLAEYNTDGTCNWTKYIVLSAGGSLRGGGNAGISFDSSNNIYVAAQFQYNVTRGRPGVAKFDSSGNFIAACNWGWTSALTSVSGSNAMFVNNYVYSTVTGQPPSTSASRYLCKWDPSLNASVTSITASPFSNQTFNPLLKKYNSNDIYTTFGKANTSPPTNNNQRGYALVSNSTFQVTNSFLIGITNNQATNVSNNISQNTTNGNIYITALTTSTAPVPSKLMWTTLDENLNYISSHYYSFTYATSVAASNLYANNYWYGTIQDAAYTSYILKIDPSTKNMVSNWKCSLKDSGGTFIANVAVTTQSYDGLYDGLFYLSLQSALTQTISLFVSSDSMFNSLTFANPFNTAQFFVFEPAGLSTTPTSYTLTSGTNTSISGSPFGFYTETQSSSSNTPVSSITIQTNV